MEYEEFLEYLSCNREIELKIEGRAYFLSSSIGVCGKNEYAVLAVNTKKCFS